MMVKDAAAAAAWVLGQFGRVSQGAATTGGFSVVKPAPQGAADSSRRRTPPAMCRNNRFRSPEGAVRAPPVAPSGLAQWLVWPHRRLTPPVLPATASRLSLCGGGL